MFIYDFSGSNRKLTYQEQNSKSLIHDRVCGDNNQSPNLHVSSVSLLPQGVSPVWQNALPWISETLRTELLALFHLSNSCSLALLT